MLHLGILKTFDSVNHKAGVQLAGSLTTYLDDIAVATNIAPEAMSVGNYVLIAIPEGNPRDACVVASWPAGNAGITDHGELSGLADDDHTQYLNIARHDLTARHPLGTVVPHESALNNIGNVNAPSPSDDQALAWDAATSKWIPQTLGGGGGGGTTSITFVIDGAGSTITTGQKGHLEIPFACTIQRVTMLADKSGSIVVDIWKDTYANFPPTSADSITASAPPTISSAQKSQDSTLTGWTKSISSGDILAFNVNSCSTITRVTISLKVDRT